MTVVKDLLQPVDNITKGIGEGIGELGHGVGEGFGAIGKGFGNFYQGFGKMFSSPLFLIVVLVGGIVLLNVMSSR